VEVMKTILNYIIKVWGDDRLLAYHLLPFGVFMLIKLLGGF
jgi:hypothetical protein